MPLTLGLSPSFAGLADARRIRRQESLVVRAESSRKGGGNDSTAPSQAGNGAGESNAPARSSKPLGPVRRRKGSLRKSRRSKSLASSMTPTKVVPTNGNGADGTPPRRDNNHNNSKKETLAATDLVEAVRDTLDDAEKDRPFIPVMIPRSDDGRVFELPYKSSIAPNEPLDNDPYDMCVLPKPIYVVSDCTGESAANTVRAALGQFENCFKTSCPANLLIFRFLSSNKKAYEIVEQAAEDNALVVFTLVDHNIKAAMRAACLLYEVKYVDLWTNLLDHMENHLEVVRSGVPLGRRDKAELSPDYFKMIEAVEYTRKMDDGAHPENWHDADLLLLGVSRSGKTPLCIYLGQRGYKVANLPLVQGLPVPKQLHEIDQSKIFGLLIDPNILMDIRQSRVGNMGVQKATTNYADFKNIQKELAFAQTLYEANPQWPVLNVTHCGVEEAAARILKILSDRHGHVHPIWAGTGDAVRQQPETLPHAT